MDPSFYSRHSVEVARALLGTRLVRMVEGKRVSGFIVEAEAYEGEEDLACHASHGKTPRTAVMYGPPGFAYVYFTMAIIGC
jgi:DNA-3-methyladenine glycosylase